MSSATDSTTTEAMLNLHIMRWSWDFLHKTSVTGRENVSRKAVSVFVIGKSGVGKTTLANALFAGQQIVLPAGGAGACTALPVRVFYAISRTLRATYRDANSIQRELRELRRNGPDGVILQQFRLMITGNAHSNASPEYLAKALRAALSGPSNRLGEGEEPARLAQLAQAINAGSSEWSGNTPVADFLKAIRDHAAGFLAPVTASLELGWPSELLKEGLDILDLPGAGIFGDAYHARLVLSLSDETGIVCAVLDRSGLDEATITVMRDSGILNGSRSHLVLVATKLDEVAREESDASGRPAAECLADAFHRARELLAAQLRQVAPSAVALRSIIHPVSATDYRKACGARGLEPAVAPNKECSGIPALRRSLAAIAQRTSFVGEAQ